MIDRLVLRFAVRVMLVLRWWHSILKSDSLLFAGTCSA